MLGPYDRSLARTKVFFFFRKRDLHRIDVRTVHGPDVWRHTSIIATMITLFNSESKPNALRTRLAS